MICFVYSDIPLFWCGLPRLACEILFNQSPTSLSYGTLFVRLEMPFLFCAVYQSDIRGDAQGGVGNTKAPMVIMMSCFIVFRQVYLFSVSHITESIIWVALGYPFGWILCSLCLVYSLFQAYFNLEKYRVAG